MVEASLKMVWERLLVEVAILSWDFLEGKLFEPSSNYYIKQY